jgi:hypothetical protein
MDCAVRFVTRGIHVRGAWAGKSQLSVIGRPHLSTSNRTEDGGIVKRFRSRRQTELVDLTWEE